MTLELLTHQLYHKRKQRFHERDFRMRGEL